jgi:hypothetical protein
LKKKKKSIANFYPKFQQVAKNIGGC